MKRFITILSAILLALAITAQDINHNRWMNGLDDNMFLWRLSIPGTHDACTSGQSGSAKTQTYAIAQQLEKGVRMFDLRPRWDGSNMYIYHGISKTNVKFNDALQTFCTFLDNNPTEFLFIIMRHEEDGASSSQKTAWPTQIYNCLDAKRKYLIDYSPTLTVREMRGKILLMSRNHYDNGPIGAYLEGGGDNTVYDRRIEGPTGASMKITTQDIYNASGSGKLNEKTDEIKKLLDRSTASNESDYRLYINHTSGYSQTFFGISTSAGVQECAKTSSQAIIDHMEGKIGPMGFIMMDFAGDDKYNGQKLIDLIINNNYSLIQQEQVDGEIIRGDDHYYAPMGADRACTVRFYRKEGTLSATSAPSSRWKLADYDDSAWQTLELPMGSKSFDAPYRYTWEGEKNTYWIRREVELTDDEIVMANSKYTLRVYHDDNYDIYVNGTKVQEKTGWTNPGTPEIIDITKRVKPGKNLIAVHIQQTGGGAYFDCGIIQTIVDPTGASTVHRTLQPTAIYNLSGQRLNSTQRGINIIGGKKVAY